MSVHVTQRDPFALNCDAGKTYFAGGGNGVCRKICKVGGGAPLYDDISVTCTSLLGSTSVGYCGG